MTSASSLSRGIATDKDVRHPVSTALDFGALRPLLASLPILLFGFDRSGVCTLSEGGLLERLGFVPGQNVGAGVADLYPRFPEIVGLIGRCLQGETVVTRGPDRIGAMLELQLFPQRDTDGRVVAVIGLASETNERYDTWRLEQGQREYRALLAAFPDQVLRLHADGTTRTVKPAADPTATQAAPAWVPSPLEDVVPRDVAQRIMHAAREALGSQQQQVVEYGRRSADRDERLEAWILPESDDQVLVILRDVTERHRLEHELQQASKLEALGRLSAGVAHEINTPTQFISNNVEFMSQAFGSMHELLLTYRHALLTTDALSWEERCQRLAARERDLDVDYLLGEVPQAVEETLEGTRRVATIVRAMKVFSHPSARELAEADVNEAIRNCVVVSASQHNLVAEVELELGDLPLVTCVVGEITQVLLNLIINSAQALEPLVEEQGMGRIVVRTQVEDDDVLISVTDNGPGITIEEQQRIFDAFYTTKEVGTGTGQGLTLVRSIIVNKHKGRLDVRSAPGQGATFEVRLPVAGPTSRAE